MNSAEQIKRDNQNVQKGVNITCNILPELYKVWCKETKRNGSVLVSGSIQEFFDWFKDQMHLKIKH